MTPPYLHKELTDKDYYVYRVDGSHETVLFLDNALHNIASLIKCLNKPLNMNFNMEVELLESRQTRNYFTKYKLVDNTTNIVQLVLDEIVYMLNIARYSASRHTCSFMIKNIDLRLKKKH